MKQKKLKYIAKINRDVLNNSTADDYVFNYIDISSIGTGDIKQDLIELSFAESPSRARRIVHVGDTIISTVRTYLKSVYHFEVIDANTIASTGFAVLTPNKGVHPKYLYYSVLSNDFIEDVCARSTGVSYPAISEWGLGQIPIFIWDYSEQKKIASFLDQKCARIDELIEKKQKLVELKKEERSALINQAVTKGLDPNVTMKDSGIEWLGKIPEHWEITRIKYICAIQGRIGFKGYKSSDLVGPGEGAITLGGSHISKMNKINLTSPIYLNWDKYYESPEIMVKKGDVVFAQRGTLGRVGYVDEDYGAVTINPSLVLLKEIQSNAEFLAFYLSSNYIIRTINVISSATAVPMISQEQIGNFYCLQPPDNEQIEITKVINDGLHRFDKIIDKYEKQVELLKEYKTTLISEAVTSKIISV